MNILLMTYKKLLIATCVILNISHAEVMKIDTSKIGKTIPESLFKGTKAGVATGKKTSKALMALHLKHLNDLFKKKQKENKTKEKRKKKISELDKDYFVVAKVGDDIITNIDILNAIKFICFVSNQFYDKNCAKLILNSVLDNLIDNSIRRQFAELQDVPINDKMINEKIEEIAKNNNKTVKELGEAFEIAGIDMEIFKKNLQSKLLLNMFFEMMEKSVKASDQALKQYKNIYIKEIKKTRYKVSEIFLKVDNMNNKENIEKQAKSIIELLNKGFNFRILAENTSNSANTTSLDELEWKTEESFQKPVLEKIKNMQVGTHSDIIKVENGYKIVYLIDKAEPNKSGQRETIYNVITGEVNAMVTSQEDFNKLQLLSEAKSIEEFKRICEIYKIKTEKKEVKEPDIFQAELIKRNKATGKTGMIQIDQNSPLKILFIESESVPKAETPKDEILNSIIIHKQALQVFNKNMKRIKAQIFISISKENLKKVLENNNNKKPN